jgi:hypothetical protein
MMFGYRKADQKLLAIPGVLKQDWTRTGNVDFHAAELESSSPQPLREPSWLHKLKIPLPCGARAAEDF